MSPRQQGASDHHEQAEKSRKKPPEPERHRVWVAVGGRCTICGTYLLEGTYSKEPTRLGELAHIVGQQDTAKSPRGQVEQMTGLERDPAARVQKAANLVPSRVAPPS